MSISITVGGTKTVIEDLKGLTEAGKNEVIAKMSEIAYDSAKQGAARHFKTGKLETSLFNRAIPGGREVGHDGEYLIRASGSNYALFVLFGSRPHKIVPKTKKALRWPNGGGFQFAKSVDHPGYVGDNYLYRAADEAVRQFSKIVDEAIK